MKVWISKYALSGAGGVELCVACEPEVGDRYFYPQPGGKYSSWTSFKRGIDAHETRKAAVQAAEAMRKKKIARLKKQIAKLEAMKFE